jgi:hypothetical protein
MDDLPPDFAAIPADHARARVRSSVPGTPEAQEAILLAQIPRQAEVKKQGTTVEVTYAGEPRFAPIPGTSMSYATNTSFDVIRVGDLYYTCFQGVWFVSTTAKGPWVVTADVPSTIYTIPPSSPKYNVTYVTVYDSTPDVVVFGYTSGYWGVYTTEATVVFGTGYYYAPYVYWGGYYPYYFAYPYSYGAAAWYNPATGAYGRGAAVYGPYGGAGAAAGYNPVTGTYGRSVAAYGPYESGWAGQAFNPNSGTYAASYQRSNSYSQWGESVVTRGDDWVHTGHYTDDRGTIAGIETSQGGHGVGVSTDSGSGFAGRSGEGDVYAGKDGNVYRRDESGWSKYDNGDWSSVEKPTSSQRSSTSERSASSEQRAAGSNRSAPSSETMSQLQRDAEARGLGAERTRQYSGESARSAMSSRTGSTTRSLPSASSARSGAASRSGGRSMPARGRRG